MDPGIRLEPARAPVVAKVQFVADQVLEQKGLKKTSSMSDLLISIDTDYELSTFYGGYQLRMLA